jgi:hypothetical protein
MGDREPSAPLAVSRGRRELPPVNYRIRLSDIGRVNALIQEATPPHIDTSTLIAPETVKEALSRPDSTQWQMPMDKEMAQSIRMIMLHNRSYSDQ